MRPIKTIYYSSHFLKRYKKLPEFLKAAGSERELIFRKDCLNPKLDTHKLKGKLQDLWSFSITHKHRIVFRFLTGDAVLFVDVGDHSIYQ